MSARVALRVGGLAVVCGCLLAALPAVASDLRPDERQLQRELRKRGIDPADVVLAHSLNSEMRQWLADSLPAGGPANDRIERLLELIVGEGHLGLQYERGHTGTAAEAFSARRANCLSFTLLFVGLARQAGLDAYFLEVEDLHGYDREGDLVVVSGHVTAGYGPEEASTILEFAFSPTEHHRVRRLSDRDAVALFHSNRGVELLLEGDREAARHWLELAVAIDDSRADAWVNLGVVRRRSGDFDGAETAYRRALEIDPELTSAYQDLAALLLGIEGRAEEARRLLALTDRDGNHNPFNYLSLGDLSLRDGRLSDAERYYRRALDLRPDEADVRAAMGFWYLEAGRRDQARKWLKRASKSDAEDPRVVRLAQRMTDG